MIRREGPSLQLRLTSLTVIGYHSASVMEFTDNRLTGFQ